MPNSQTIQGRPVAFLQRPREAVLALLKRGIVMNELAPGTVITELGVARELGCSQGTVREALMRLQEDGLVIRAGRRGTVVTGLPAEEAQEILALRRRIEMRGALGAVRNTDAAAKKSAIARLELGLADMRYAAAQADAFALIEHDMAFHLELFRLSGLQALEQILVRCMLHSHRFKLWAPGHRRTLEDTASRHQTLIDHLANGKGAALSNAIGQHIDSIVDIDAVEVA